MSTKRRRQFSAEFRAQAVDLVRAGKAVPTVAAELEVETSCLYAWVRKANAEALFVQTQPAQFGSADLHAEGKQSEVDELRGLRRELARLQLENDILKKAAVILGTKAPNNAER